MNNNTCKVNEYSPYCHRRCTYAKRFSFEFIVSSVVSIPGIMTSGFSVFNLHMNKSCNNLLNRYALTNENELKDEKTSHQGNKKRALKYLSIMGYIPIPERYLTKRSNVLLYITSRFLLKKNMKKRCKIAQVRMAIHYLRLFSKSSKLFKYYFISDWYKWHEYSIYRNRWMRYL